MWKLTDRVEFVMQKMIDMVASVTSELVDTEVFAQTLVFQTSLQLTIQALQTDLGKAQ